MNRTYRQNIELFGIFFRIGIGTIGGGYAMIPMMEHEIVDKRKWLEREEFLDILAVAQTTPGVFAVDMSQHIGHKIGGLPASIVAILGVVSPSFIIILLLAMLFHTAAEQPLVEAAFKAIRPVVVALIAAPVFTMARSAGLTKYNWWIPVLSAGLIYLLGVSPVYVLLAAGILGYLWGVWHEKKS